MKNIYIASDISKKLTQFNLRIIIIDGGPRKTFNGSMEHCITQALGEPEKLIAYNTYQVKNYANYELVGFSEEEKRKCRDEHWEDDLQQAYDAGRRMTEKIIG